MNITETGVPFYSRSAARKYVKQELRNKGLIITYLLKLDSYDEPKWVIEQFVGDSLRYWDDDSNWSELEGIENYSITGDKLNDNVVNNEDINFNDERQLQLADRIYDELNPNGMGYVILRKDKTFTEQIEGKTNTIFEIRYDFDLDDAGDVTIPENCVLKFTGGTIRGNCTLIGNNTCIQADLIKIFNTTVLLEGTWKIDEAYIEWFGGIGDGLADDSDAFYAVLKYFDTVVLLDKTYSINFRDKYLYQKTIFGRNKDKSKILQRNINVPFAHVVNGTCIHDVIFEAKGYTNPDDYYHIPSNTEITDILSFGYLSPERAESMSIPGVNAGYKGFRNVTIYNVTFNADYNLIPLHFNIKYGGTAGGYIYNIDINTPYIGIWYEFKKVLGTNENLQWITNHVVRRLNIIHPYSYGFRWDALSMAQQGVAPDPSVPTEIYQTMWCYANTFEDIKVSLNRRDSVGFKVGQGMATLNNPIVFNDLFDGGVGYAMEFVPITSPTRHKMFTQVIGGNLEGELINRDFTYSNIFKYTRISLRNNRDSYDTYDVLDDSNVNPRLDLNFFGAKFFEKATFINCSLSAGTDGFGDYIKITRSQDTGFGVNITFTRTELNDLGIEEGLYTLQAIAESNRGGGASGTVLVTGDHSYEIDGKRIETYLYRGTKIINSRFVKFDEGDTSSLTIFFGQEGTYPSGNPSRIEWIKIYNLQLYDGIIGYYKMFLPEKHNEECISRTVQYTWNTRTFSIKYSFETLRAMLTYNTMPISVVAWGRLPQVANGTSHDFDKIQFFTIRTALIMKVYDKTTFEHIANLTISALGIPTLDALTDIADNTLVIATP